jgi:hypothetical protein
MWRRVYQAVLVSCSVGIVALSLRRDFWVGNKLPLIDFAAFIGLGLLPVAAVGLWNLRLWGFVILVTGMFLVAGAATFHLGVVHGLEWTSFHFACLFATVLLYFGLLRRRPDDSSRWAELCIHCDGSGTCKNCGGTGALQPIVQPSDPRMPFLVPCANCSGTGKCLACQVDLREITTAEATNWRIARDFLLSPVKFPTERRFASLLGLNSTGTFFSLQRMFLSLTLVGIAGSSSWYLTRPELLDSSMYLILLVWGSFLGVGVGILWKKPFLGALIDLALTWMALKFRG